MQSIGPTIAYDSQVMFDAFYTRRRKATMPVLVLNGDASFAFMPDAYAPLAAS